MVLLIIVGIILLLPGLCSLAAMLILTGMGGGGSHVFLLWLFCFAVSAGGIWLIRFAVRKNPV